MAIIAMEEEEEASDFGWLPEDIKHHILSFCSTDDKIKARTLSKEWLNACLTYPKLKFNERHFKDRMRPFGYEEHDVKSKSREDVNNTLLSHKFGGILLPYQLDIIMDFTEDDVGCLDRWLRIAVDNGIRELTVRLLITSSSTASCYLVPDFILEAKSLTKLSLDNCKFPDKLNAQILCKNILSLILWGVSIHDDILRSLMARCPWIEHLEINDCKGLNTVKVINLPRLKEVQIFDSWGGDSDDESLSIEIDAPNLETVDLTGVYQPHFVELHAYGYLRSLYLVDTAFTDAFFDNFMNKFPHLRSLVVVNCFGFGRMNLTSHSLGSLELSLGSDLLVTELEIDAPNLSTFHFDQDDDIPKFSFKAVSAEMKSTISLTCESPTDISWFLRLNEMLSSLVPSTISLYFHLRFGFELFDLDENISLKERPFTLFDGLFLACCPEAILLYLSVTERVLSMGESLHNKLVELRNQESVRGFKMYAFKWDEEKGEEQEQPLDWMTVSDVWEYPEKGIKILVELGWNLPSGSMEIDEETNNWPLIEKLILHL